MRRSRFTQAQLDMALPLGKMGKLAEQIFHRLGACGGTQFLRKLKTVRPA